MKIIVVGGGKLVYYLCRNLLGREHELVVINRNDVESRWLARRLKATVLLGDGSDPTMLDEAGANDADAVVAVTPSDPDNLVICQVAKLRFGVPHVVAVLANPDNEVVFPKLGIRTVVSLPRILSSLVEEQTTFEDIVQLTAAAGGKVHITQVRLTERSPILGRPLADVPLPSNSLISCVIRNEEALIPHGKTELAAGDEVVLVTLPGTHHESVKVLTGDPD